MRARYAVAMVALCACSSGSPPDLHGLTDQIAAVGQELVIQLDGDDPDGDRVQYSVAADIPLVGATITQTPSGVGVFRWTPLGADVGMHAFDFTVSDGSSSTTVSISVDVRSAIGAAPIFRAPLGTGTVLDLAASSCVMLSIVVEDQDTPEVTIGEEEPRIAGTELVQTSGTTADWQWCPTPAQAQLERHTLVLSADDGENPKTKKAYIIVVRDGSAAPQLVLNEVDYDQINSDTREMIEIYNPGDSALELGGLKVVLVNGSTSAIYDTIDLAPAGSIPSRGFLVIGGPSVTVPPSAAKLDPVWTQDEIQNGAPDGLALIDDVTHVVVDRLSYEGSITNVTVPDFPAPVTLVEGTPLPETVADSNTSGGSLCRNSSGRDTNDAAADWRFCTSASPGTANP